MSLHFPDNIFDIAVWATAWWMVECSRWRRKKWNQREMYPSSNSQRLKWSSSQWPFLLSDSLRGTCRHVSDQVNPSAGHIDSTRSRRSSFDDSSLLFFVTGYKNTMTSWTIDLETSFFHTSNPVDRLKLEGHIKWLTLDLFVLRLH